MTAAQLLHRIIHQPGWGGLAAVLLFILGLAATTLAATARSQK